MKYTGLKRGGHIELKSGQRDQTFDTQVVSVWSIIVPLNYVIVEKDD